MRYLKVVACGAAAWFCMAGIASADVQLTIADGRVSLVARDATVRQILAEWARIGQTRIVNGERVPGGPVTLELRGVPEAEALDIILRGASGFVAAPRVEPIASASQFDRIIVMPTSTAPPAQPTRAANPSSPIFPQPGFQQPGAPPTPPLAEDEGEEERAGQARPPVFNPFPPPQATPQQQPVAMPAYPGVAPAQSPLTLPGPATNTQTPTTPFGGVATPGMIVQPPPQQVPGQPVIPGQPRRPGGPGGQ